MRMQNAAEAIQMDVLKVDVSSAGEKELLHRKLRAEGAMKLLREFEQIMAISKKV